MIKHLAFILFSLFSVFNLPSAAAQEAVQLSGGSYQLGAGDVIRINVFGEKELSFDSIRLNDAGSFSYPFLGQVTAKGLSATALEQSLRTGLMNGYLKDPRVSVSVLEYRPFFITGEVKSSGGYVFQPGLTIRRAVALAGGLTPRASENRITIIRETNNNKTPEPATMDTLVAPGDSINIDQGFF